MRRIILVMSVALVMAAMMAVPAFAQGGKSVFPPECEKGQNTAAFHHKSPEGSLKHLLKIVTQCNDS